MAEQTKIEWTDHTFNPWVGCTKISPACDHCYAEAWANRTGHADLWKGKRRRTTEEYWKQPLKWNKALWWEGRRGRVFCASLADVFDNQVSAKWRYDLWMLIRATPNLDWQLLTKRPQNILKFLPSDWGKLGYNNVWLGVTTENQTEVDRRIEELAAVPARVRFLSCEPLLQPILVDLDCIQWVICGGESGGGARTMEPSWARELRDQCRDQRVPFFMKQMAKKAPIPDDLLVRQFPI